MANGCNANNIPASTLSGWIRSKKATASTTKNKVSFIEVGFPAEMSARNTAYITIEYKAFKITVPAEADFKALENTLKVVAQLNV